jgi:hypothetical protein
VRGRETPQLVVGAEHQDVDRGDHACQRPVVDLGAGAPASLVEGEVGAVTEVQQLEVVLQDAVEPCEQPVVGGEQQVGGSDPAPFGDDRFVLELRELRDLECDQLVGRRFDLLHPPVVELVPVLEVVAAPHLEQLRAARHGRLVRDRVRADVHVAVQDP